MKHKEARKGEIWHWSAFCRKLEMERLGCPCTLLNQTERSFGSPANYDRIHSIVLRLLELVFGELRRKLDGPLPHRFRTGSSGQRREKSSN